MRFLAFDACLKKEFISLKKQFFAKAIVGISELGLGRGKILIGVGGKLERKAKYLGKNKFKGIIYPFSNFWCVN
jgi:hypothetical protein